MSLHNDKKLKHPPALGRHGLSQCPGHAISATYDFVLVSYQYHLQWIVCGFVETYRIEGGDKTGACDNEILRSCCDTYGA